MSASIIHTHPDTTMGSPGRNQGTNRGRVRISTSPWGAGEMRHPGFTVQDAVQDAVGAAGTIPDAFAFPSIHRIYAQSITQSITQGKIIAKIEQAYRFAQCEFGDLDRYQLGRAREESMFLANSPLFDAELMPDVCIDPYGEFTFSHRSNAGYVDIGVRGVGELSYHVRNDIDPDATRFDDYKWTTDYRIPMPLFQALQVLKQQLKQQL